MIVSTRAMLTNPYPPRDNVDLKISQVLPALMRKAHEVKLSGALAITIRGSGTARRVLLNVDVCADACVFLMRGHSDMELVYVRSSGDLTISELAHLVCDVVSFFGKTTTDPKSRKRCRAN